MRLPRAPVLLVACASLAAPQAHAQPATERPLRMIVAAAPGTATDEVARALLPGLGAALGRTVIIDNRGAMRGIAAAETAARADPNGTTLLLGTSATHAALPAINAKLPYDALRDFVAVSQIASIGMVVASHPRLPEGGMDALLRYARSAAAPIKLGSHDAVEQTAAEALGRQLGFRTESVMHKTGIAAMLALTGGTVDLSLLPPYAARPHVHAGRLRAYGITGTDRSSALPELPTFAEQGIAGYELPSWDGLFVPAGTPLDVVDAFQRGAIQALANARVRATFMELGIASVGSTPAEFAALVRRDLATFRRMASPGGKAP